MSRLVRIVAALCLCALAAAPVRAVVDLETSALPDSRLEILVVEIDNCIYCGLFRRDVAPTYKVSSRAKTVPMRFININAPDVPLAVSQRMELLAMPTVEQVMDGIRAAARRKV